jgi:sec-independent protein translocase protein TatB
MFDIDAGKILVVGVVALLVIGPKDLPRVLRTVGQTVGKMRRMATEFQNQFMEAIKEADLEDVKKEFSAIRDSTNIDTSFDAASLMRDEITTAVEGPKGIGQSTIDLTGTGAMKEIPAGSLGAPAQESTSLAAAETPPAPAPELSSPAPETSVTAPKSVEAERPQEKATAPHPDETDDRAHAAVSSGERE